MKRFISSKALYVGQLVVTGDAVNSTVRTVAIINTEDCVAILQWVEDNRFYSVGYDSYMLKKPTLEQIEWHLANNGQLVSSKMLVEVA